MVLYIKELINIEIYFNLYSIYHRQFWSLHKFLASFFCISSHQILTHFKYVSSYSDSQYFYGELNQHKCHLQICSSAKFVSASITYCNVIYHIYLPCARYWLVIQICHILLKPLCVLLGGTLTPP